MTTEVSKIPRDRRRSATRFDALVNDGVHVVPEPCAVDARGATEQRRSALGRDKPQTAKRGQLTHGNAVSGHHKGLATIEKSHYFPTGVAELSLRDYPAHQTTVAPVATGTWCVGGLGQGWGADEQFTAIRYAAFELSDEQARATPCTSSLSIGGPIKHLLWVMSENANVADNPSGEVSSEEFQAHAGDFYGSFALADGDDFADMVATFESTHV